MRAMAMYRMLSGRVFEPEDIKAMTSAYEAVLAELDLVDRHDALTEIIASKIIALCQTGICEAGQLAERTMKELHD